MRKQFERYCGVYTGGRVLIVDALRRLVGWSFGLSARCSGVRGLPSAFEELDQTGYAASNRQEPARRIRQHQNSPPHFLQVLASSTLGNREMCQRIHARVSPR